MAKLDFMDIFCQKSAKSKVNGLSIATDLEISNGGGSDGLRKEAADTEVPTILKCFRVEDGNAALL